MVSEATKKLSFAFAPQVGTYCITSASEPMRLPLQIYNRFSFMATSYLQMRLILDRLENNHIVQYVDLSDLLSVWL